MKNLIVTFTAAAILSTGAHATTLDFSSLSPGSQVTADQYSAFGVKFVTEDSSGDLGIPAASSDGFTSPTEGISNSASGDYPTTEFLNVDFNSPTSVDAFTFNNYGNNAGDSGDPNGTTYTAFDAAGDVVGSGNLSGVEGTEVFPMLADVSVLQFDNGFTDSSWEYVLGSLTYGAVPEPSTWALLVAGLLSIGGLRFFRKNRTIQS